MNRFTSMSALLEELSPDLPASGPGWDDVLVRTALLDGKTRSNGSPPSLASHLSYRGRWASERRARRRGRRLIFAIVAACAVVIPLVALAAANDWWFFQFRDTPAPLSKPVVVTKGSWSGHAWELVAYTSPLGTCWSITFPGSNEIGGAVATGEGAGGVTSNAANALACGGLVGLRPPNPHALDVPTVMFQLGGSVGTDYPHWIAGPVVQSASSVVVRYPGGPVVRVPTTRPVQLGHVGWYGAVRFFAAQLPERVRPFTQPESVTALAADGRVVGCFARLHATSYFSPLSACRR